MHLATVIHPYSGLIYCFIVFKISFKDTVCHNSKIKNLKHPDFSISIGYIRTSVKLTQKNLGSYSRVFTV